MKKKYRILAVNPGSTSTKIALFENDEAVFSTSVSHDASVLDKFEEISDQFDYRKSTVLEELEKAGILLEGIDAFVGRGGSLVPIKGGTYFVNDMLLYHAQIGYTVKHPAMLGAQLVHDFAGTYGSKAYVVNPPDVDEFDKIARITGFSDVFRESRIHALNQKEIAIRYSASAGEKYEDLNLIIVHAGGGVSVTAHRKGRMVDSNDIVNGDGPMAPTRSGALPAYAVVKLCFSGRYNEKQMYNRITKTGGFVDHLGTSDGREVSRRAENGDAYAKLVYDAMIYQISKHIGSLAAALKGEVDAIILTGGMARDKYLVKEIKERVRWIAGVETMAGEFEMEALAAGAMRVLTGEEEALEYSGQPVWKGFER